MSGRSEAPLRVVVIGAGPAGLAAAYRLAQQGIAPQVLEADAQVGGLARTLDLWGQRVDLGPHRFLSTDPRVNALWSEALGDRFTRVDRITRILYRGRLFRYPLEAWDVCRNLGPAAILAAWASYLRARLERATPRTFEEWVCGRFGRRLYEAFFKTYTEKVWGIPCSRVDARWASQRIRQLSFASALKAAFSKASRRGHKTLAEQFNYPQGGSGTLYERMADEVRRRGGAIRLQSPVRRVLTRDGAAGPEVAGVELASGETIAADRVISTMPLTLMTRALGDPPASVVRACEALRYRNTLLVYLEIDRDSLFPDNWIYVHSPEARHGRITNFRNWCPSLVQGRPTSILCLEYWCFDEDPVWKQDDASLGNLAETELRATGLLPEGARCLRSHVIRLRRSYPVYEVGYTDALEVIQGHVDRVRGLLAIGRYGSFKYNNQDHSLLMGILAAERIASERPGNLWDVNTDSEYLERAPAAAAPAPARASID